MIRQEEYQTKGQACPRLYLVSNGNDSESSGLLGLTLCLRKEPWSQNIRCIYSANQVGLDFENPDENLQEILDRDLLFNVIDENGRVGCYIHSEISPREKLTIATSAYVGIDSPGDLSTLNWHQGIPFEMLPETIPGHTPIDLSVVGLNFKDVMIATGNLSVEVSNKFPHCYQSPLGLEFSGTRRDNGKRVCGISQAQAIATQVLASEELLWEFPSNWGLEDAATIPVVYSTVIYFHFFYDFKFPLLNFVNFQSKRSIP